MKTGLAVLAALIGSTNAKMILTTFEAVDEKGKYGVKGNVSFFKHPTTGKPYISVEASYTDIELKDGFAMCFDFAPVTIDAKVFLKGKNKDKTNFPISFAFPKGETATTSSRGLMGLAEMKKCTSKDVLKLKVKDKLSNASPNQDFSLDEKTGKFSWIRPICDGIEGGSKCAEVEGELDL